MSESHNPIIEENPFRTRRIRPGAMPFLFPPGQSAELLVAKLQKNEWWGEIVGPHGSGKSSLLAALVPVIEQAGRPALLVELHDGQRQLPIDLSRDPRLAPPTVVIVDGYEQLDGWNRGRLRRCCRSRALGLLVTAHRSVGLPLLFRAAPNVALAERIVRQMLAGDCPNFRVSENGTVPFETRRELTLDITTVRESYARHNGDLREMLFDLYDLYQERFQSISTIRKD